MKHARAIARDLARHDNAIATANVRTFLYAGLSAQRSAHLLMGGLLHETHRECLVWDAGVPDVNERPTSERLLHDSILAEQRGPEDGKLDLTNPRFVEAADWYSDLVKVEKVASLPPSASEAWWGEDQYAAGNIAMTVGGTWSAAKFFQNQSGFAAGATRLPVGEGGPMGFILGSGFGISATCQGAEREAALKVLGALVSKEAQDLMASIGRSYPAVEASQPLYFESLPAEIRQDVKRAFEDGFKGVQGQRTIPTWPQINEYLTPNLLEVYTGRKTMQELMETTQKQFGN